MTEEIVQEVPEITSPEEGTDTSKFLLPRYPGDINGVPVSEDEYNKKITTMIPKILSDEERLNTHEIKKEPKEEVKDDKVKIIKQELDIIGSIDGWMKQLNSCRANDFTKRKLKRDLIAAKKTGNLRKDTIELLRSVQIFGYATKRG